MLWLLFCFVGKRRSRIQTPNTCLVSLNAAIPISPDGVSFPSVCLESWREISGSPSFFGHGEIGPSYRDTSWLVYKAIVELCRKDGETRSVSLQRRDFVNKLFLLLSVNITNSLTIREEKEGKKPKGRLPKRESEGILHFPTIGDAE